MSWSIYAKAFIAGSSIIPIAINFWRVPRIVDKNYSFSTYTIIAPLWIGIMNTLGLALAQWFGLSTTTRYVVIALISAVLVMMISTFSGLYTYTAEQWRQYYARILFMHLLIYCIIIRGVEYIINK